VKIVFRTDGNYNVGIGHLMRCLALSEELTKRGHTCIFFSKIDDELINKTSKFNINYQKIKSETTLDEDLKKLISYSKENKINWIITDNYEINSDYIQQLKQNNINVLSVDDAANMHYYSDIVLNQNIGAEKLNFSIEDYTQLLSGSKYIMMRNELLKNPDKNPNEEVRNILITLGGTERDNLTLKILQLIEEIVENKEITVVTGPFNPSYQKIKDFTEKTNLKINLIKSPKNMSDLYLKSDIAISAGGSSCYELAYYGIPNIIITIAENQINNAKELNEKNIGIYLGSSNKFSENEFKEKLKELINNKKLRETMSKNGKTLVDGQGKKRIVDEMEKYNANN